MNTNINCFQLMNNACKKLKGNFWRAVLASLVVIAPLVAVAFIPYYIGIVLALFCSGYLFYGLIVYYKKLFAGEKPSLKVIFTNWDRFGAATLIGIINVACLIFGTILLLLPALAYMVYYGVNLHLLSDQSEPRVREAFTENNERMYTNRTLVLSYKVLCYFLFVVVLGLCAFAFMPIVSLSLNNYALALFLGVLVVLGTIIAFVFINVLYQATQLEFYTTCLPSLEDSRAYRKERNEAIIAKRKAKEEAQNKSETTDEINNAEETDTTKDKE